jgi:inner membrane protease subunit 2
MTSLPSTRYRTLRLFSAGTFWCLALTIGLNDYLLEITPIYGSSMSPTLSPSYHATGTKDYLAWRKWLPTQDLKRGDIVMYATPFRPEGSAVKRVIALGGDTVVLDGRRRPGGEEDVDDDGVKGGEKTVRRAWDAMAPEVRVPFGHVWLEGDNWRASQDSNYFGPVSRSLIVGKAMGVVWPPERWGRHWCEDEEGGKNKKRVWGNTRVVEGVDVVPEEFEDLVNTY